MKSSWLRKFGSTNPANTFAAMPRAMGRTKNGIGALATRLKINFSSSGGIAEPSAKCSQ